MGGLLFVPSGRHGREGLYVCLADGTGIAWYDPETGRVDLIRGDLRDGVLKALCPCLTGHVTIGPPPVPTPAELVRLSLHPDDGLAPNRPGEALLVALDRERPASHVLGRLRPDPRRRALEAERAVGTALDHLEGAGRHTLHSVRLPGGDRIHHPTVGPGGLFAVHSLNARRARVVVAGAVVTLGRREPEPLLRHLRGLADRASRVLTAEVRPVLALLGPAGVRLAAPLAGTRILCDDELEPTLTRLGGHLKPADAEPLHATARDRRAWTRV